MTQKGRLSATVDTDLLSAAHEAVAAGRAENVSAWVNDALRRQLAHDQRMAAFARFLDDYEAVHGRITEVEMADAARSARERAVVVRGAPRKRARRASA